MDRVGRGAALEGDAGDGLALPHEDLPVVGDELILLGKPSRATIRPSTMRTMSDVLGATTSSSWI